MQDLTWKTFRDRLGKERDRVSAANPPISELVSAIHPEELSEWFIDANDETRTRVREAVAKYIATKKWPTNLTPTEQAFVTLRLDWATSLANILMICPGMRQPSMDTPEEHVMSWFLLNSWECAGTAQTQVGLAMAFESLESVLACKYSDDGEKVAAEEPTS